MVISNKIELKVNSNKKNQEVGGDISHEQSIAFTVKMYQL